MYLEQIPFLTFPLAPIVGVLAWLKWIPLTSTQCLVGFAVWLCWQRFAAAGYRFPGRKRVSPTDAAGKVALVTGANTGIGLWTAVGLVEAGAATVFVTCRDEVKIRDTIAEVRKLANKPTADVRGIVLELGSFKQVKAAAEKFKAQGLPLHILINNAGAAIPPVNGVDRITEDGLELGFQGNFVSPILFTELLMPLVVKTKGRVVNVSSYGHTQVKRSSVKPQLAAHPKLSSFEPGNDTIVGFRTYCLTKLGNLYHAQWLTRQYPAVTSVSLHPGAVVTDVWRPFPIVTDRGVIGSLIRALLLLLLKSSVEGAATTLHCALSPKVRSGKYYVDEGETAAAPIAASADLEEAMMSVALAFIKPYLTQ